MTARANWSSTPNARRTAKNRKLTLDDSTWAKLTEMAGPGGSRSATVAELIDAAYGARGGGTVDGTCQ